MVRGSEHVQLVEKWCMAANMSSLLKGGVRKWIRTSNMLNNGVGQRMCPVRKKKSIWLDYSKHNISETEFDYVFRCYSAIEISS
jgi:hypothetical protein